MNSRAVAAGWQHVLTILKDRVRQLRPYYLSPDPSSRTEYHPGHRVRCDLPSVRVPLGAGQKDSPPVLVMTSGHRPGQGRRTCVLCPRHPRRQRVASSAPRPAPGLADILQQLMPDPEPTTASA